MADQLSHFDINGEASMVDTSEKPETARTAVAVAFVAMSQKVLAALPSNKKGDPLQVARVAGIMAAKKTSELIPLCHPIALRHVTVDLKILEQGIAITATAATYASTGVEMEALTAASVAALTVYDMTKALDKSIEIQSIKLVSKTGGKSGNYHR